LICIGSYYIWIIRGLSLWIHVRSLLALGRIVYRKNKICSLMDIPHRVLQCSFTNLISFPGQFHYRLYLNLLLGRIAIILLNRPFYQLVIFRILGCLQKRVIFNSLAVFLFRSLYILLIIIKSPELGHKIFLRHYFLIILRDIYWYNLRLIIVIR
jgi:hypothetical protein